MKLRNLLKVLITGSLTMILQACYGIVAPTRHLVGKVVVKNSKDQKIPGIKVSYKLIYDNVESTSWTESGHTDSDGVLEYDVDLNEDEKLYLKIEDVDGTENLGDFKTKELEAVKGEETTVVLEEK